MKKQTNAVKMTSLADSSVPPLDNPLPEISAALKALSGKWTLMILCQLSRRVARFNELKRTIPGITQHMLTTSLRQLESQGLVNRTIYAEVPPRVEYRMTPHGLALKPVIEALAHWGQLHLKQQARLKGSSQR